jgi:hypothetical protein
MEMTFFPNFDQSAFKKGSFSLIPAANDATWIAGRNHIGCQKLTRGDRWSLLVR